MTYTHYGEIGDVWKHLPLAELLSMEPPRAYWESHAASGLYDLAPTPEQEYGAVRYLERAHRSAVLERSPYTTLLDEYRDDEGRLSRYPGSPVIAMHVLDQVRSPESASPSFIFCDVEADAIGSLEKRGRELGVRDSAITTVHGDGLSTLMSALSETPPDELAGTFVHLDPYWPGDTGENGSSSWDVFCRSVELGARAMLWYGYQTQAEESAKNNFFEERIGTSERGPDGHDLWIGEVVVDAFFDADTTASHPGVFGCGIVCGNVRERAIERCREVGAALVSRYAGAELPDGNDGSLSFIEPQY